MGSRVSFKGSPASEAAGRVQSAEGVSTFGGQNIAENKHKFYQVVVDEARCGIECGLQWSDSYDVLKALHKDFEGEAPFRVLLFLTHCFLFRNKEQHLQRPSQS